MKVSNAVLAVIQYLKQRLNRVLVANTTGVESGLTSLFGSEVTTNEAKDTQAPVIKVSELLPEYINAIKSNNGQKISKTKRSIGYLEALDQAKHMRYLTKIQASTMVWSRYCSLIKRDFDGITRQLIQKG